MQISPEISLKGLEMTNHIDDLLTRGITKLEQVCDYIISTRIALEQAQRHQTGNVYRMRIEINIPDRPTIVVKRESQTPKTFKDKIDELQIQDEVAEPATGISAPVTKSPARIRVQREEPLQALIRRAFDSAQRELKKAVDKQRGEIKTPAQQQMQAVVEKIFREQQYGFLRALDGQQIYFHKNSVLHNHWDSLTAGTIVRYSPEIGEKGLQASTVEPVDKPGVAEIHEELHDLPSVASSSLGRKRQPARARS